MARAGFPRSCTPFFQRGADEILDRRLGTEQRLRRANRVVGLDLFEAESQELRQEALLFLRRTIVNGPSARRSAEKSPSACPRKTASAPAWVW